MKPQKRNPNFSSHSKWGSEKLYLNSSGQIVLAIPLCPLVPSTALSRTRLFNQYAPIGREMECHGTRISLKL
ncbi:hypothetical protein DTO271G3_7987 [Paecilomyces variotii]|nr:hypothetical protein DTO271G3_7987 [Paecilomyces variotii]